MATDTEDDRISIEHDGAPEHDPVILPASDLRDRYSDDPDDSQQQDTTRRERRQQADSVKRRRAERRARQKVVERLKEKGKSDRFIARHQELIDEKVQDLLQDRE